MATKMKGLFKGLRYISQIFEEEKDQEMQIGFPTDVKHVAHIGWDGPSATAVDSSPSWMKEFKSPTGFQSAPLDSNGNNREDPEVKWVSEDSKKGNRVTDSPGRDLPEVPRSSRRHNNSSDNNNSNDSPMKKNSSTKSRQSRRNHSKDSSEGSVKSGRQANEPGQPSDSPPRAHPDLAKKSRRKKSKEADGGGSTRSNKSNKDSDGGSTRSRSKDPEGSGSSRSRSKPAPCGPSYSDHGLRTPGSPLGPISSMHDEEKERRVIS
ncbi:hypothetical protein OROHE_005316 [Orobanche hederae]